ncbi:CvpA family protein [Brachyspira hyodysenteriae]|uniref:CvpA family protein n=1 Tax=Brachyspira hyodysenteriae TaxID=159 RepID=UPI00063DAC5F|nr:CvpA family protein [Brachyspira hyodysenteriae]KLI16897.1 colicin V production protein [Brachyspira hyodysenteriae]MBT8719948.1 CvpA family protein [Brachyspira hyodysenteriae]MBT8730187.1 CvpA family protein [Brachyspira hyodysenteriae]MBT8732609.1 CvpA family protein [Brachyspira hyodysenteriae]MBT8735266.1 CvpA family protein [Brachyspira hyodysenteriae]
MFSNIDILLITILAFALIYGLYKGLISTIIPVIAIIITFVIAPLIYNHMSKYFDHSFILKVISLIAAYSIIRIILSKVEKSIKDILKIIYLSWVDRIIGAAALLFISTAIIYLIVGIIITLSPENTQIFSKSIIINYIFALFHNVFLSFEKDNYMVHFIYNSIA